MANVGALDQVRSFLREHPDLHCQQAWVCGTTACVAGWTVALDEGMRAGQDIGLVLEQRTTVGAIAVAAARILGLNDDEELSLFHRASDNQEALDLIDALIAPPLPAIEAAPAAADEDGFAGIVWPWEDPGLYWLALRNALPPAETVSSGLLDGERE